MKIPYLEEIKEKISNKRKTAYYARRHGLSAEEYRSVLIAHYDECVNFFENINVISINFIILYSKLSYGKKRKFFPSQKNFMTPNMLWTANSARTYLTITAIITPFPC